MQLFSWTSRIFPLRVQYFEREGSLSNHSNVIYKGLQNTVYFKMYRKIQEKKCGFFCKEKKGDAHMQLHIEIGQAKLNRQKISSSSNDHLLCPKYAEGHRTHQKWTIEDWKNTASSDESGV